MAVLSLDQKEFLDRKECAQYLAQLGIRISHRTLANLAGNENAGGGPPFYRVRWSRTYYKRIEVETWAKSQTERVG